MRLTDSWLKAVRPRQARYDVTVENRRGLMVRVHPSGAVSFRLRYKRGKDTAGRPIQYVMVLGEYPAVSLALAYQMHDTAVKELAAGLDPIEERARRHEAAERQRQERAGADTVSDLVEQFVHRKLRAERWDADAGKWVREAKATTKARKRPDAAAALLGYVEPSKPQSRRRGKRKAVPTLISELGNRKARDVTRRDLVAFLDGIVDRSAPVTANRVYSLLKQMFAWAAAKDIIPAYPMLGMERPGGDEKPRKRTLSEQEIGSLWTALEGSKVEMAAPTRFALKLLLVTAQRRGEVTGAKWSEFDLEAKNWTIPVARLKSSHSRKETVEPHVVPLSPFAIELLEQLKTITGDGPYLLPAWADKKKDRSYSERVLSRAVRENSEHFAVEHFTPHDLRRTAASFMTKLKVPRLHVEKVLNHSTGDIAEVYDRHDYLPEKRAALDRWAEHLQVIISGAASSAMTASP